MLKFLKVFIFWLGLDTALPEEGEEKNFKLRISTRPVITPISCFIDRR
jgi:hypothetical protein